jgi:hypothetical protein
MVMLRKIGAGAMKQKQRWRQRRRRASRWRAWGVVRERGVATVQAQAAWGVSPLP